MGELILQHVPVKKIVPNALNPRKDLGSLGDLRKSIVSQGLIQPLRVRMYKSTDKYELIAGERRFTAIKEAIADGELPKDYPIPVVIENIDDDQAVHMMFVENLMRKDLSDYEQAKSFKEYLDKIADPKALEDLSGKTGLNIAYIRRRAKVMELPASILKAWENGKLAYGHLEQFLRLDPAQVEDLAKDVVAGKWSISDLKKEVERSKAIISQAFFDTRPCGKCQFSTKTQRALFGDDFKMDKVTCTNPKCYYEKQEAAIKENWNNIPAVQANHTNGIVLSSKWGETAGIHGTPDAKCQACEHFVTQVMIDGSPYYEKACKGNRYCFAQIYQKNCSSGVQAPLTPEEKQEVRTEKLGKEFAEQFYQKYVSEKLDQVAADDPRVNRIICFSLINAYAADARKALGLDHYTPENEAAFQKFKDAIFTASNEVIDEFYQKMTNRLVFGNAGFNLKDRVKIAEQLDTRIERDFVMDTEYLSKKTKAQLIELSNKFGIIKTHSEDELLGMKKTTLVDMIAEQDLTGMIPDEIAAVAVIA